MKPKNFPLQNKFTWGFELEGKFRKTFLNKLYDAEEDARTAVTEVRMMFDGSVNVHTPAGFDTHEEISLGIFEGLKPFYKYLAMFKEEDYKHDTSCGMHIHMSEKEGHKLTDSIYNWKFLDEMQRWTMNNLPEREQNRIRTGTFCKNYPDKNAALRQLRGHTKYRAIARRANTTELRLFSTKHRYEASQKFLEKFLKELDGIKDKPVRERVTMNLETDEEEIELPSLDLRTEEIELTDRDINRTQRIGGGNPSTAEELVEGFDEAREHLENIENMGTGTENLNPLSENEVSRIQISEEETREPDQPF